MRRRIFEYAYVTVRSVIASLALFLLPVSCSSTGNNGDGSIISDTTPTDSIKKDSVKIEEKLLTFSSSEDAIDYMKKSGHWDSYSSGILPRMARENIKYATKLLNNKHKYFIVVDKAVMKVMLYSKYGNVIKEYKMACARNYGTKHKKADSRTPEGFFSVSGIYDSTDWLFTDDNGVKSEVKGQFGPRFIRLATPVSYQIGIHGTRAPWSLGSRCSHGCIRISNDNIMELVEYAAVGMPVIVSPGPRDMRVNFEEGYDIPAITTGANRVEMAAASTHTQKKETFAAEETTENPEFIEEISTEKPGHEPSEPNGQPNENTD